MLSTWGCLRTRKELARRREIAGSHTGGRWKAAGVWAAMVLAVLTGFGVPAHAAANTVISLTFDDSNADQLTAAATMKNLGLHGTFYTVSGWIDQPSYLTSANLQQLAADGNEIGGHTVTHPDLINLTSDEVTRQVCNGRVALMNMGFKVTSFAYPFADQNASVQTIVKNCGFNSARGLGDLYSKDDPGLPAAESIPPANAYDTAAPEEVDSTWTLQNLEDSVTKAQAAGGGWVQLTFHHIATNTDPTLTISPTLFNQFASWLAQQQTAGSVAVKTVDQVVGGAVQPAVLGPAAPPPPPQGTNMIQNPSLETLTNGIPQCWAAGGYGTNTPSFSVVSPGHTGNNAELLTMSGYVSGDAKLLPALDLGGCSPTGTPGHIYQLSAWYQSDVITQFEVYYRTGTGYWTYWTASPLFNAASNWTQITWTTPALPAGASGISYGLNIQSNGSITADDYSMIDVTPAGPTAPAAPTGVAATAGNGSAVVSWTAPSNGGSAITSYAVTPHAGATALTPVTVTGNPPATTATVTGLTNGTAYTFTVTATNAVGTSPASAASAPVTPMAAATAPAAPTGVAATAGNGSAVVSWTAPSNGGSAITSYAVTPHAGATALTPVTVSGNPPATTATVTGLTNGTAYTFTVTATNAVGTSAASAASAPVTPMAAATAPAAPTGVTATAGNGSAVVSWTAPNNGGSAITSYAVTPHVGATALTPVTVTGNPPATTATVTGLMNGTAYTFTVTATNAVGTSAASAASAPVTPTGTTSSTIINGGFESGLSGWTTGGVRAPVASNVAHTGTGSALLGLPSGAEPLGDSSLSQTITVPATGTSTLSFWYQPHTADDTCNTTTCQYDWMEAQVRTTSGTTLASLFKLCNNNGTWTQLTADLSAYKGQTVTLWFNVHLDGSTPADDTWMYLDDVTLTNTQTTATAPAAPTGVTATAGNGSAVVSWTAPSNGGSAITSYAVTPHAGATALTPVTVTGNPPATTATVTGLMNGTAYTFTVTATNAVGTSAASAASAPVTPTGTTSSTIINGGFESGLSGWTTGGVRAPVASNVAHTGTGSALLGLPSGAEPLGDSSLSQTITVPATGTSTLSFWYQPHTADDTCNTTTCQYDWMEAQVRTTSGTTLASLFKLCNNNGTWTQLTADLSAYKGQTVTLWFNVHLDGSTPADDTWMYLDDVTLTNG
ncbi:fibronectin type III domain-containing protein [Arthrobacter sp. GN70]|nr:fibronectin type III domain-containing protein [Arthrobacter sp. GN70]